MSLTSSQKHAERRRKIEEERAERRRLEEEAMCKRMQKRKSSSIPAKWYWTGGIKIGGTPVRRFVYAGSNMKDTMVASNIPEPSLLNPVEPVAESSEGAQRLGEYPMYQYLSPEQRRGYIDFLASDREDVGDIGYVFLYLYGLERRLIIDAAKPGEVSEEERADIIGELLRLDRAFGKRSRSVAHYIAMLLLYDGTVFDMLPPEEIKELFGLDGGTAPSPNKNREMCDNSDSMPYLMVSRLVEHGMAPDVLDIAAAAKGRFLRSSNAAMLGISREELYSTDLDKLLMERLSFCDMSRLPRPSARSISGTNAPVYYPSSPMIRKKKTIEVTSAIAKDPEELGVPLKAVSDMIVSCKKDLDECANVLSTSSLRDIDKVQIDALSALSPASSPLHDFLASKNGATYVPIDVIDAELKHRFHTGISYTSKGILSTPTQQLVAISAAMSGWQAMLPDVVEGAVSSFWRIDEESKIVMFERGCAHNKRNGKRCIGPVFGGDENTFSLYIPGSWAASSCLAYVYAWFVAKLPNRFDKSQLTTFLSKYYPPFSAKSGNKKNQIAFFFSLLHATYSLKLSTHGIKKCLEMSDFASVQELVFTLCDTTFGNLLPEDVMESLEELYKKAGQDPSRILYDYHAGTYQKAQAAAGFVIDEEKFAETMADTTSVQDMLSSAMDTDVEVSGQTSVTPEQGRIDNDFDDINADASEESAASSGGDETATDRADRASDIRESIEEFFGDTDEKPASELLSFIVESGWAATTAEAMGVVANVNAEAGDELVEIDGADAYWNG